MARRGRVLRWVALGLASGLAIVLVLVLYVAWTDAGRERVRRMALDALDGAIDGEVTIGRIEGNLLRRARLIDVSIVDVEGRPFMRADTIETRVSLLALLLQRIRLSNVRIVNAMVVLDKPPSEEWNFSRILKLDEDSGERRGGRWGRWVSLRDVDVVDSRLTIRTAWDAPDDLSPAEKEEALRQALSPESRENIVAVAGGFQNVMDFRQLDAGLGRVLLADPDSAALVAEVERLSGILQPYRPPVAEVRDLAGNFRLAQDSLFMADVVAVLPGSRFSGEGVYALESGELLLRLDGEPAAFADLRWLLPSLPEEGGGPVELEVHRRALSTRVIAREADMRVGASHVTGHFDVTLGDTVQLRDTDLRFEQLDTRLVGRVLPALEPPRHGVATGHLVLDGTPESLRVDGNVAFTDVATGTSNVTANGTIGVNGNVRLSDLALRFDPLQAELARAAIADFPFRGTIVGTARLTGEWKGMLAVDSDLTFRDPRAGPGRVRATGRVDTGDENRLHEMRVVMSPLYLDVLRETVPDLPRGSTVSGSVVLSGVPTRMLSVNGDVALREPSSGESRIGLEGGIETAGALELHALALRFHPLQPALLPAIGGPELPVGGTIEGTAVLNGLPSGRLAFDADLIHREAGDVSHVFAEGQTDAGPTRRVAMDMRFEPLALATVGRVAPETGLKGSARGTARAKGNLNALAVRGDLQLEGGANVSGGGTLNLGEGPIGYDLDLALQDVDLSAVTTRVARETDLSGRVLAAGRGTEPATLQARVQADLYGPPIEGLPADEIHVTFTAADGLAQVEPSVIRLASAEARVQGSFGLVEERQGVLAYQVSVDSLQALAPWIPGADTAVVPPRSAARSVARAEARARLARALRDVEVERMATGRTPAEPPALDTLPPPAIPRDSLAGSIQARGELRGSLVTFDAEGTAEVENLVFRGNLVGSGETSYSVVGVGKPEPDVSMEASVKDVLFQGLAYDSATVQVQGTYTGARIGFGSAHVNAFQDKNTELEADAEFSFAEASGELRFAELRLRVDSVTWRNTGVGLVHWAEGDVEIRGLHLVSDAGGLVQVDGVVPAEGPADLALVVENLEVAHLSTLLQEDLAASGDLTFAGRLRGTRASPTFDGDASWSGAALRGALLPDARGRVSYAHSELSAEIELLSNGRPVAFANARLPINLALSGVEGSRLLDAPLSVEVEADSLPLQGVAGLTPAIQNVQGSFRGSFRVSGTFDEPVLSGGGDVVGGALDLPELGVPFHDITGRVSLERDVLVVDSLIAWSRGSVRVSGEVDFATLTEPTLDLVVEARDARVLNNDEGKLDIDADLTVSGPLDYISVDGEVRTRQGVIYIPSLSELGATDMVALDDPVTFERVDTLLAARRDLLLDQNPFLERLDVDVWVSVDRDVWMRSLEANVEIYTPRELGPVRVQLQGGRRSLLLEGTINADRGEYEFMARRFQLTRGAVSFLGGEELDAILQVVAEHHVQVPSAQPIAIRALISGTLRAPAVTLESSAQPPISQTDLLTYLVFGRQAASLLPLQGSALSGRGAASGDIAGNVAALATQQLSTAAVGTLVNDLEGEAARSLGVDVFRITPADLPEELFDGAFEDVLEGTEIEIGSYVGSRLFLAAQTRAAQSRPGVTAEYVTPRGFRWLMSWQPRFLPAEPTLQEVQPIQTSVLGMFLFREWRF